MTVPPEVKEESVGTEHKEYSDSQTSVTPVKYVRTVKYSRHLHSIILKLSLGPTTRKLLLYMPYLHCRI